MKIKEDCRFTQKRSKLLQTVILNVTLAYSNLSSSLWQKSQQSSCKEATHLSSHLFQYPILVQAGRKRKTIYSVLQKRYRIHSLYVMYPYQWSRRVHSVFRLNIKTDFFLQLTRTNPPRGKQARLCDCVNTMTDS